MPKSELLFTGYKMVRKTETVSAFSRSDTSFNIEIPLPYGSRLINVSLETTSTVGAVFAKIDVKRTDVDALVSHIGSGNFSNLGSFSIPLSFNIDNLTPTTFPTKLKASILNQSGIDIATTLFAVYEEDAK